MRFTFVVALALVLAPTALYAGQAASGVKAAQHMRVSVAKKYKKAKQPKEEYLKAAPGTGPSGPTK